MTETWYVVTESSLQHLARRGRARLTQRSPHGRLGTPHYDRQTVSKAINLSVRRQRHIREALDETVLMLDRSSLVLSVLLGPE